jgi:hypothetical protein
MSERLRTVQWEVRRVFALPLMSSASAGTEPMVSHLSLVCAALLLAFQSFPLAHIEAANEMFI